MEHYRVEYFGWGNPDFRVLFLTRPLFPWSSLSHSLLHGKVLVYLEATILSHPPLASRQEKKIRSDTFRESSAPVFRFRRQPKGWKL